MAHILLIDPMAGIRRAVSAMLGRDGHTVALATDAAAGRSAMRNHRFDLVITDVTMPALEGSELLRDLTAMPARPQVIVMSAGSLGTVIEAALHAAGVAADAFLDKPFEQDMLLATVDRLLRKAA